MDSYLSKFFLILLGVFIFLGLAAGGHSLRNSGEHVFQVTVDQAVKRQVP